MENNNIKENEVPTNSQIPFYKKKWFIIGITILVVIIIVSMSKKGSLTTKKEHIDWSNLILSQNLPEPKDPYGKVSVNSMEYLTIDLYKVDRNYINDYKSDCIKSGYVIESNETTSLYEAFNSEGYKVRLLFYEEGKLTISLDAPEKMSEFKWPTIGLGAKIPSTKSNYGRIAWDNSKTFIVHVGNTPINEFNEYVEQCQNKGYVVDYSKSDGFYKAKNQEEYELTLRYLGFNVIEVALKTEKGDNSNENNITNETNSSINDTNQDESNLTKEENIQEPTNTNIENNIEENTIKNETKQEENVITNETKQEEIKKESVFYSTNDQTTVRKGNTGVYAYRSRGGQYYNYYIIDFDKKYVYFFSEGNGTETCDRLKIKSGDLNSTLTITYHDDDMVWEEYLHFKYKNMPDHLILVDNDNFEYDFYATDLKEALKIRDKKEIHDY